jgi:5-(hydroxymethyl)furfural/furfural oxidase
LCGIGANLQNHPCIFLTTYLPPEAAQVSDNPSLLQNWLRFSSNFPGCAPSDMHLMAFNKLDWHRLGARIGAVVVSVLKSYSKGCVQLSSADPAVAPAVHFNLLSDPRDEERLLAGLRFALQLLTDPDVAGMRRDVFIADPGRVASLSQRNVWNGVKARTIALLLDCALLRRALLATARIDIDRLLINENALRSFLRRRAQLQYHVCGTCRMGQPGDPDAVVDSSGKIHGMRGLRVVDASIFPTIPRGYPHFIVIMTAEKMADAVKSEWS